MNVDPVEVESKKQVGALDGDPVMAIGLKGGGHLIVALRGRKIETLGAGSHPGIARHVAKKKAPSIVFNDLAKSEPIDAQTLAAVLPYWEHYTDRVRARQGY